jgi:acyl dehydratase
MFVVDDPREMKNHVGRELGPDDWIILDQTMIDKFADATGDHQWVHVDVERAAREMPGGTTIAHGYLTLSLLPQMVYALYDIRNKTQGINYGSNRIRFVNPVPAGSRVRLRMTIGDVEDAGDSGVRIHASCTIEIEGEEKPALVAETLILALG